MGSRSVMRLKCKGFIFAVLFNHIMTDSKGLLQFMTALGETAMGASGPSINPVWEREMLKPRLEPSINFPRYEYDQVPGQNMPVNEMNHASFFFGPKEIATLKRQAPKKTPTFEVLSGWLWRVRTRALNMAADEEVRFTFPIDVSSKFEPPLPHGYYGNSFAFSCAKTTVGELANKPLSYAVELINRAKTVVNNEYMRSVIDLM
ncbi:hypothetical protein SUGI_0177690 [Cryptomeria japonica]|nr:hypothetical protein SUGI_0177690 [Cryptomeria japonica]